jgi:hypothetical protein
MLIYTYQKSKKKSKTKKELAEYQDWLDSVNKQTTNFSRGQKPMVADKKLKQPKPFVRETPHYPSLDTPAGDCTKPIHGKVYTGTSMIGIGTLHKSNAVPIFNSEDALDQAKMRR